MDDNAAKVAKLLRQQAAVAGFGSFALRQTDLLKVLTEAAKVCAEGLSVPFSKVCEYRPKENDLLIVAGYGWKAGLVGHVVPEGQALTKAKEIAAQICVTKRYLLAIEEEVDDAVGVELVVHR